MKKIILLTILLATSLCYSQNEAANWYFGNNAGINFDTGTNTVSALLDGQLATDEGCTSISDSNGDLLFYTDGITVFNKNHQVMANGNGLKGNPSSTQSAIIIPKPQDPDIYYIFTVDTQYQNTPDEGFHYSEVDMSLNTGLGEVTNNKNINLLNNTSEKLSAVLKDCQTENIWVITFANSDGNSDINNSFYAYEVTSSGVNTTPVVSIFNFFITERRGYLKISPDGSKIACANIGEGLYLFDFDTNTGQVSNPQSINININPQGNPQRAYGVEFSPSSEILYVSTYFETPQDDFNNPNAQYGALLQYDLNATNISASENVLDQRVMYRSALQLGPDGKIYRSLSATYNQGTPFLSTINSPNNLGQAADYQHQSISLNNRLSRQGLPPFIASFFVEKIDIIPTDTSNSVDLPLCTGDNYTLIAEDIPGATYTWTQDGNPLPTPSTPNELLINQDGNYEVVIDLNNGDCDVKEGQAIVTYYDIPTATMPNDIIICDDNNDNVWTFNLSNQNADILNGQDASIYQVSYYISQTDADNKQNPLNINYQNVSPIETIYARVENIANTNCFATTSFNLEVYQTPVIPTLDDYLVCDDSSDGDDTNGQTNIDLSSFNNQVYNGQSTSLFNISYHSNLNEANANQNPLNLNYYNTTPFQEEIFVRLENMNNIDCYSVESFNLIINPVPESFDHTILQCDEDGIPDGYTIFNLEEAVSDITNGDNNLDVIFYNSLNDAENENSPITNSTSYNNLTNPQVVFASTIDVNGCSHITELTLEVSTTQINNFQFEVCDELGSEDGFNTFNLTEISTEMSLALPSTVTINFYETYNDALTESNILPTSYNNTNAYNQTIFARAENNNDCYGISEVNLVINQRPELEADSTLYYCLNDFPEEITLSATTPLNNTYYYSWSTGENTNSIQVNQPGTYTVTATTVNGCEKTRTFVVEPSNIATISDIIILDGDNAYNQVTVQANGEGIYQYELVNALGISTGYQDNNTFTEVPAGLYTVNVRDVKNNCGVVDQTISVIGFPSYFTPNNDGVNDYWQVYGVSSQFQPNSKIFIFDRYGKLLKQIDPKSEGWDGNFNGQPMPSNDYWFSVTLQDGRVFKSHFTLKR